MASLTDYHGLEIVTPDPTGAGGAALNNNFKKLALWQASDDPETTDNYAAGFGEGSRWFNTTTKNYFICRDPGSAGAPSATWEVLPVQNAANGTGLRADSGGSARGADAVDLQRNRTADTQVASGPNAVVGGGRENTASGPDGTVAGGRGNTAIGLYATVAGGRSNTTGPNSYATVAGGRQNTASGTVSMIGGGYLNDATGTYSIVGGGYDNTSTGYCSTVGGGYDNESTNSYTVVSGGRENIASGLCSMIPGGYQAKADCYGQLAHAAGMFAVPGDAQTSVLVARTTTTNSASLTELFLDGSAERITLEDGDAYHYQISVVCRCTASTGGNANKVNAYRHEGVIKRVGANTTLNNDTPLYGNQEVGTYSISN